MKIISNSNFLVACFGGQRLYQDSSLLTVRMDSVVSWQLSFAEKECLLSQPQAAPFSNPNTQETDPLSWCPSFPCAQCPHEAISQYNHLLTRSSPFKKIIRLISLVKSFALIPLRRRAAEAALTGRS